MLFRSSSCNKGLSNAAITLRHADEIKSDAALGNGTVDAIFKVIDRLSGIHGVLKDYKVSAVSQGKDALANVVVKVEFDGKTIIGHGLDIDTIICECQRLRRVFLYCIDKLVCQSLSPFAAFGKCFVDGETYSAVGAVFTYECREIGRASCRERV